MNQQSDLTCGLDEVGRGCLAGPLVAAGLFLKTSPQDIIKNAPAPIRNSKLLSALQRQKLNDYLRQAPVGFHIETIHASWINKKGIAWVNRRIFLNLIDQIKADRYVVDGSLEIRRPGFKIENITRADDKVLEVTLASIVAKVYRDSLMVKLHCRYPRYDWASNKGYGTRRHQQALKNYGPTPYHRSLFIQNFV